MPKVTIITACYNSSKYLEKALESVSLQRYQDYELLIINDASTDNSLQIINSAIKNNPKIKLIYNDNNEGLARSLNTAIENSDSNYIARFDTDDLMYPERLSTQVSFMESKNIGLLGSQVTSIGKYRRSKVTKYPTKDNEIRVQLLFQSAFAHPSTIFKRSALGHLRYNPDIKFAEDYDLWVRMSQNTVMGNIDKPLLYYRKHSEQISSKIIQQNKDAGKIRLQALKNIGINFSKDEGLIHSRIRYSNAYSKKKDLMEVEAWLLKLVNYLNSQEARDHIKHEWYLSCIRAAHFGLWTWNNYQSSKLHEKTCKHNDFQLHALCLSKIKYRSQVYNLLEAVI